MRVKADGVDYDYTNHRVVAVGNVQIYYNGATIEADRVVYDQNTKRLRAEGNARLTEANGKVTVDQVIDLTDRLSRWLRRLAGGREGRASRAPTAAAVAAAPIIKNWTKADRDGVHCASILKLSRLIPSPASSSMFELAAPRTIPPP